MAPKEKVEWVQLFIFLSINVSYKYKLSTYMSSYTAKLNGHPHDCRLHFINTQSIAILLDSQAAMHQATQGYVDGGK